MDNEIKQNKKVKIGELLHSILYPQEDLRRSDTKMGMPSQEGLKSKGEGKHRAEMLGKIKSASLGLIVFLSALVIILLCTVVTLTVLKDLETQKRTQAEDNLRDMTKVKDNIQLELDRYITMVQFLEENLNQVKNLLAKGSGLIKELLFSFKKEKIARLQLEQQLNDTKSMLTSVMFTKGKKVEAVQEDAAKGGKEETEEVIIRSGPMVNGNVLIVDKESGLVLVNLGKKDNLSSGMTLAVTRDNMLIARLLVERVEEKVSAARIVPSWRDISIIKEGDLVRSL